VREGRFRRQKRLKALEEENAKLKKLLADQMLEASALRELLSKKW
jgi:putative transposase